MRDIQAEIGGMRLTLRPTFAAISAIEAHFGAGILAVARRFHDGEVERMADYVAILRAGVAGAGGEAGEDFAERVAAGGLLPMIRPAGTLLARACGVFE